MLMKQLTVTPHAAKYPGVKKYEANQGLFENNIKFYSFILGYRFIM